MRPILKSTCGREKARALALVAPSKGESQSFAYKGRSGWWRRRVSIYGNLADPASESVDDAVAPPESANTAKLAVFAESGGATIDASESVDDAVAPPDSANTAKFSGVC